jgi:hypothetical protein
MQEIRGENILVITSHQRAGSTPLRDALGRTASIYACGEIFHHVADHQANFFEFLKQRPELHLLKLFPTDVNTEQLFQTYLSFLFSLSQKPTICIDVKFNLWLNMQPIWGNLESRPWLLERLVQIGAKFVLIKRENCLAQFASAVFADAVKNWHYGRESPALVAKISINVDEFFVFGRFMNRLYELFDRYFYDASGQLLKLTYERMFRNDGFSTETTTALRSFLGVAETNLTTELVRTPVKWQDTILNLDEVATRLKGTPYYGMLEEMIGGEPRDGNPTEAT